MRCRLSAGTTTRGVMNTTTSCSLSVSLSARKARPMIGALRRPGTPSLERVDSRLKSPDSTMVSPAFTLNSVSVRRIRRPGMPCTATLRSMLLTSVRMLPDTLPSPSAMGLMFSRTP
jgi:hypothetical protein